MARGGVGRTAGRGYFRAAAAVPHDESRARAGTVHVWHAVFGSALFPRNAAW